MTKKLDFDFKYSVGNEAFYVDGKCISKGNEKAYWLARKLKDICQTLDKMRDEK